MQSAAAVLSALGVAGLFAPAPLPAQAASPVISELKVRRGRLGRLGRTMLIVCNRIRLFNHYPSLKCAQIRESVKGVKDSADALKLYEDFVTQKARPR